MRAAGPGAAGLPVLAMMPESPAGATASISGPNGPLETCTVSGANTNGVAKQLLDGDNVVVAIPRAPLVEGVYHVTIRTNARTVAWTFTVDKSAADGKVTASQPVDAALTTSGASTMQPVAPARVVDTRISRGAVPFDAGTQQRIQITGTGGVPAGATAVVANITATEGAADGFVTLWNCAGGPPNASTLNFHAGQNVPNSATIPLDASGGLCAFAYAPTQLIVDVTGYDAPGAPGRYNPVTPTRIMDSRLPLGPSSRLDAGQTAELHVAGTAGLPVNPTAVVLNVTAADASELGFVTVYPCGTRPETSNLNPTVGDNRANLVTTTLSASGNVCLFTLKPTDLVVDVVGYFATTGRQLAVTTPFRFTDTRETNPQLNAERNGRQLAAGVVTEIPMAGVRGISAGATAVSVNITAVNATSSGWIAAWPCTGSTPTTSNVNYGPSSPVANAAQLTLSSRGSICVVSYTDVDLIIDVNGWWA